MERERSVRNAGCRCGETPQGGVISPLLANLYLSPLNHPMAAAGWEKVHCADDLVILCGTESAARQALATLRAWVAETGRCPHLRSATL